MELRLLNGGFTEIPLRRQNASRVQFSGSIWSSIINCGAGLKHVFSCMKKEVVANARPAGSPYEADLFILRRDEMSICKRLEKKKKKKKKKKK